MRRRNVLFLQICLLSALYLSPAAVYAVSEGVPEYHKKVMDNGATVVACYMPDSPIVTVQIRVLAGLSNEGKYAGTGISHFIEHMVFRAVGEDGVTPARKAVKALGGHINGSTGQDSSEYHITVPKEHFRKAMEIITGMVLEPVFDEVGFDTERNVILKEMNMLEDNPGRDQLRLLFGNAYRANVYKNPIIGHRELFLSLEKEDLEEYHSAVYVPDRLVVGLAGGVAPNEVFSAADDILGKYERAGAWEAFVQPEPRQVYPSKTIVGADVDIGYIALGFHSVSIYSQDLYPLNVAASVLGSGIDSLLYRRLVREKKLLHSVSAFNLTPRFPGLFIIVGTGEPGSLMDARREIFDVINGMKTKSVTAGHLMKARNMVISSYLRSHESTHGVVSAMTGSTIFTGNPHFMRGYIEGIGNVAPSDVAGMTDRYLTEKNSTVVYTVPREFEGNFEDVEKHARQEGTYGEEMEERTLENGLKLIVRRAGVMPVVSVTFACHGGLMAEDPEENGLSNLMAALLLKETKKRREKEIVPAIEKMGGSLTAFSGLNSFGLSMSLMSGDIEKGFDIFSDVLRDPVFRDAFLEEEKRKIIAGIREREKNIFNVAVSGVRRLLYGGHPYALRPEGEVETVEKLDRAAVEDIYSRTMTPRGSVISIAGDVDVKKTMDLLSRKFSSWRARKNAHYKKDARMPDKGWMHEEISMRKNQSLVAIGFRGVTVYDERKYVLDVISALLSGKDGILFDRIRDELGLAYTSGVSNSPNVHEGYFLLYTATTDGNIDRARDGLFDALEAVIAGEVTDLEISSSKERMLVDQARSLEGVSAVSSAMALGELYGLGSTHYEEYGDRISEVTRSDVVKVAGELLDASYAAVLEIRSDL
jgi:zinc protease